MIHYTFWIALACIAVMTLALSYYGSTQVTDIPYLPVPYTPKDFGLPFESISFITEDGLRLTGWFVPAASPSETTLIIQHGVGSNAGDMLLNTVCLRSGPWNLFYYNFRGHADSQGKYTSLGTLELRDLTAALNYLKKEKPVASRRLAIYGHSLGAAVAIVGAALFPELEAVAAESPFRRAYETVERFAAIIHGIPAFPFVPIAMLFANLRMGVRIGRFSPVDAIGKLSPRPVFLIQAERDKRAPMEDAQALYAAAREPKELWVVKGADHGDPWMVAKEEYESRLTGFFRKVFPQ